MTKCPVDITETGLTVKRKETTLSERVWNSDHSWHYERVFDLADGQRLRSKIRRNSYDFQSSACVDRWTGEKWENVLHRSIGEMGKRILDISYVAKIVTADAFATGAREMEADAKLIVGVCK